MHTDRCEHLPQLAAIHVDRRYADTSGSTVEAGEERQVHII